MKAQAAVLWETGKPWSVEEVELARPGEYEVLVRNEASGLCHSDHHVQVGDSPATLPLIGGHEGAGVVEEVGSAVRGFAPGDHVVYSYIPSCGQCRWCSTGHQNLCDIGAFLMKGATERGPRAQARGQGVGALALIGTFANYSVAHEASLVKVPEYLPFPQAALLACGVPTGWGSAVYIGQVKAGDTVVVVGAGGIGMNAVQGARLAGAEYIIVVDPAPTKQDAAPSFGATHTAASMEEAVALVSKLTWGVMADVGILTAGVVEGTMIAPFLDLISKNGVGVLTGIGHESDVKLPLRTFTLWQKQLRGTIYGGCNPRADIPRLIRLYGSGHLKLDELVSATYPLEEINQGYTDMIDGKNIRGVVTHQH
ncbi:NDMA-dependent alcohol dehydrogenase [Pseudonocardia ailaonensis]|uniref:NDMA-dependent alcohol dehydrogenase n=1 Tax=Pseudonocardia ailaonensis TaxID=367279 RepID=A0ABN2MII2_9PSEU